jgi:hypothetical protein
MTLPEPTGKDSLVPPPATDTSVAAGRASHTFHSIKENEMKKLFTKNFFRLSESDQAAVVDAVLRDLNQCWANEQDYKKAERRRKAIIKKAVEYGIYAEKQNEER